MYKFFILLVFLVPLFLVAQTTTDNQMLDAEVTEIEFPSYIDTDQEDWDLLNYRIALLDYATKTRSFPSLITIESEENMYNFSLRQWSKENEDISMYLEIHTFQDLKELINLSKQNNLSYSQAASLTKADADNALYFANNSFPSTVENNVGVVGDAIETATSSMDVGEPANDLPCDAESIALGSSASATTELATATSEPAKPSCWEGDHRGTVWFTFVAPASGGVDIATGLGSIESTQIAVYSGPCSSLTLVDCDETDPRCGAIYQNTNTTVSGLTPGDTYFVAVDGEDHDTGTFDITISDHAVGLPIVYGQDCGIDNSIPVCNAAFTVGDPGFQATGNYCDFDGAGTCTSGERGSVWYHIEIESNGNLQFTLEPNNYTGPWSETDYDFLLYKTVGTGAVTCEEISNGAHPVRCNYSARGVTGLNGSAGNAPWPYPGSYNGSFEPQVAVTAGEEYFLVIQNYSNSAFGFDFDLGTTPIYIPPGDPTELTWTGGANTTNWFDAKNWGACSNHYPDEDIDANIVASSTYQPVIANIDPNNSNNARAKSLTISSGANLTLNSGQTFEVYGDYDNSGTLNADVNSTTLFVGSADQDIDGSLQGTSAFGDLTINKAGGEIRLLQDSEITGDLTTSNASSTLNTNNTHIKVAGDISLFHPSTYTNFNSSGVLEFNGSGSQAYQTNGTLTLRDIIINNTGTGLYLSSDHIRTSSAGSITLTNGIVHTSNKRVIITNTSSSAISGGSTDSYINGKLRAFITNNNQTYNLPVGDASQYAKVELKNNNLQGISRLDVRFLSSFTSSGALDPTNAIDFGTPYTGIASEGIWEIIPNNQPTNGSYSVFLIHDDGAGYDGFGLPVSNDAFIGLEDNQFGILKRDHTSNSASAWYGASIGTMNANDGPGRMKTDGYISRYGLTSFSDFAIAKQEFPLAIELSELDANCTSEGVLVNWVVESENNSHYYTIERSLDAERFEVIGEISVTNGHSFPKEYSLIDREVNPNIPVYYRLKEYDNNGKASVFKPVMVDCDRVDNESSVVSGRQIGSNEMLVEAKIPEGIYQLSIFNDTGKLITNKTISMSDADNEFLFDASYFTTGIYFVLIQNKYHKFTSKVSMN